MARRFAAADVVGATQLAVVHPRSQAMADVSGVLCSHRELLGMATDRMGSNSSAPVPGIRKGVVRSAGSAFGKIRNVQPVDVSVVGYYGRC